MVRLIIGYVLLITYSSAQSLIDLQTETKQSNNQRKIVGTSVEIRRKRVAKIIGETVLVGLRAIKNLLKEADLISKNGPVSIYLKQGGYKAAYLDFHNLDLDYVKDYGIYKWGFIGDRRVSLEGETMNNPTRMVIQRPHKPGSDGGDVNVILYKKAPTPEN